MGKTLAAAALLGLVSGCSTGQDLSLAQAGVANFHRMLNAQAFAAIYAASGPEMKEASSQADMVELFAAVHRKLGAFQSGAVKGWYDRTTPSAHFVTVSYPAKYDNASVVETFGWRIDGGHALLTSYFISSTYMITH